MNGRHDDHDGELTITAMDWALAERLGGEVPPDLRERVRARLALAAIPGAARRSSWLLAAAALFGVGIVLTVAVLSREVPRQGTQGPPDDAKPKPAPRPREPVTVSSRADIEALPADTTSVVGVGIEHDEAQALLRLSSLQRLELRGVMPSPIVAGKPVTPVQTIGDDDLAMLTSLRSLRTLHLVNQGALTKRGYDALAAFPALSALRIDFFGATDDDLVVLSKLPKLESLALHNSWNIRQPTVARIAAIRSLRSLDLSQNGLLETAWLKPLADMTDLQELRLASVGFAHVDITVGPNGDFTSKYTSAITDELIDSFAQMRSLHTIDISWSNLTPTGRQRLQALLPDLRIVDTTPSRHR